MNTRLAICLLAAAVATGCGNNGVQNQDIREDSGGQDVAGDTNTGQDNAVPEDTRTDNVMPTDVNGQDNLANDAADAVEDVLPVACISNSQCGAAGFCNADQCNGSGFCKPIPGFCIIPDVGAKVCACDNVYYESGCFANMGGINVGTGADCGTSEECSTDAGCTGDRYCRKDSCDAVTGLCTVKPTVCSLILAPVCGCNGATFNNSCEAAVAGVSVDTTEQACANPQACQSDDACTGGFCYKRSCEATADGTCEKEPIMCLMVGDGICGCDGTTYANECLAMKAGIATDPTGVACNTETTCLSNDDCFSTEYCRKDSCGAASGTCATIPVKTCTKIGDAVCGCDGVVYPNACVAVRNRTNYQVLSACGYSNECSDLQTCGKGTYCFTQNCLTTGICAKRPLDCESGTYRVCGCDNATYKNYCEAARAGVSVDHEGMCIL